MSETKRLDAAMVERGLAPTRARACDAILRGHANVAGRPAAKPAQNVADSMAITAPGAWGIFLVKPQFEVGPSGLGKGGIVRDTALAEHTAVDLAAWVETELDWRLSGVIPSPIDGGDGNREFLLGARRD